MSKAALKSRLDMISYSLQMRALDNSDCLFSSTMVVLLDFLSHVFALPVRSTFLDVGFDSIFFQNKFFMNFT
jgi:hypothetical protein